jgi:hypothetical protein
LIIVGGLKDVFIGKFRVKNYWGVYFFSRVFGRFWSVYEMVGRGLVKGCGIGGVGGWGWGLGVGGWARVGRGGGGGNGASVLGSDLIKFYLAIEIKGWVEGGGREINF